MMNVLLLADLHGEFGKLDSFLALSPDAFFIAGDITNMGPADCICPLFSRMDVPSFAVPGNCDPVETLGELEHSECVCLHGSQINLGRINIVGLGGSNPTPFNTPFEMTEEEIDAIRRGRRPEDGSGCAQCPPHPRSAVRDTRHGRRRSCREQERPEIHGSLLTSSAVLIFTRRGVSWMRPV